MGAVGVAVGGTVGSDVACSVLEAEGGAVVSEPALGGASEGCGVMLGPVAAVRFEGSGEDDAKLQPERAKTTRRTVARTVE